MIKKYIKTLIKNLPKNKLDKPEKIDIILEGGAFNGSYILGALYFLKELERKNYIIIKKISTCSISSILALLYLTDNLDKANELYFDIIKDFKKKGNLSKILKIKDLFKQHICNEKLNFLNKKLYICYNNIDSFKKRVVCKYKDIDELFDVIIRSCFIPFLINFQPSYKDKYIDDENKVKKVTGEELCNIILKASEEFQVIELEQGKNESETIKSILLKLILRKLLVLI